jgi:hypothetical protein
LSSPYLSAAASSCSAITTATTSGGSIVVAKLRRHVVGVDEAQHGLEHGSLHVLDLHALGVALLSFMCPKNSAMKTGDLAASMLLCAANVSPDTTNVTSAPFLAQEEFAEVTVQIGG